MVRFQTLCLVLAALLTAPAQASYTPNTFSYVDVRNFGCVPNGTSDCTAGFNAAMAAAQAQGLNGVILGGTTANSRYYFASPISVPQDMGVLCPSGNPSLAETAGVSTGNYAVTPWAIILPASASVTLGTAAWINGCNLLAAPFLASIPNGGPLSYQNLITEWNAFGVAGVNLGVVIAGDGASVRNGMIIGFGTGIWSLGSTFLTVDNVDLDDNECIHIKNAKIGKGSLKNFSCTAWATKDLGNFSTPQIPIVNVTTNGGVYTIEYTCAANLCPANGYTAWIYDSLGDTGVESLINRWTLTNIRSCNTSYICADIAGSNDAPVSYTGTFPAGATQITNMSSMANLGAGQNVTGTCIAAGTTLTQVLPAVTGSRAGIVELSLATTCAEAAGTITFTDNAYSATPGGLYLELDATMRNAAGIYLFNAEHIWVSDCYIGGHMPQMEFADQNLKNGVDTCSMDIETVLPDLTLIGIDHAGSSHDDVFTNVQWNGMGIDVLQHSTGGISVADGRNNDNKSYDLLFDAESGALEMDDMHGQSVSAGFVADGVTGTTLLGDRFPRGTLYYQSPNANGATDCNSSLWLNSVSCNHVLLYAPQPQNGQVYFSYDNASALQLYPSTGGPGGLLVGGQMQEVPSTGLFVSNAGLTPSTSYYFYVTNNSPTVTGTTSSGGFVKLTLSNAANFATGDKIVCSGIGGTVEANGPSIGTYIDSTHILLNVSFVNAYVTSSGYCNYLGIAATTNNYTYANGIAVESLGSLWPLVGGAYLDSAGNFDDSTCMKNVASWYNPQLVKMSCTSGSNVMMTTSASLATPTSNTLEGQFYEFGNQAGRNNYAVQWGINASIENASSALGGGSVGAQFGTSSLATGTSCSSPEPETAVTTYSSEAALRAVGVTGATKISADGLKYMDLCVATTTGTLSVLSSGANDNATLYALVPQ